MTDLWDTGDMFSFDALPGFPGVISFQLAGHCVFVHDTGVLNVHMCTGGNHLPSTAWLVSYVVIRKWTRYISS